MAKFNIEVELDWMDEEAYSMAWKTPFWKRQRMKL